jgi:YVTN family beta-propeller protein
MVYTSKISNRNVSLLFSIAAATAAFAPALLAQSPTTNPLVTGKRITQPPLGVQANVGSLPMHMVLSPDGRYAVATDMGFRQALSVLDTRTGALLSQTPFLTDVNQKLQTNQTALSASNPKQVNLYYGLAFAPTANADGSYTLYASQGSNAAVGVYSLAGGVLTPAGTVALKPGDFAAGLATDARGYLYVAVNEYYGGPDPLGPVTQPGRLLVYNTAVSPAVEVARLPVGPVPGPTPPAPPPNSFPLAVAALGDGSRVYVSSQRDGAVYVFNASTPTATAATGVLPTGAHPDALLLNRAQTKLYVANAHSDTVSVFNTADNSPAATVLLRPDGTRGLAGATPTGLGLSPDEGTLYVTLGDMNAVAVVNLAAGSVFGYIPTGWYPTAVVASPFKKQILVADAKGTKTRNPNPGQKVYDLPGGKSTDSVGRYYDLNIIEGQVQTLPVPNSVQLSAQTRQVIANNRLAEVGNVPAPLDQIGLTNGGIQHVIYIVKENRTYDQVLGDLPQGNGQPDLAIFGRKVTPNLHALAERFVLLDNFYDCGEASGDGWPWSTQGIANEYVIKNLPYNYSSRGRNYDFEGQNNGYLVGGFAAKDPNGKTNSVLFPGGAPPITDVAEAPAGHIWDLVANAKLSYRNYGFFTSFGVSLPNVGPVLPDNYPTATGLLPPGRYTSGALNPAANGITDFDFRRFDGFYPDSDAPSLYGFQGYPTTAYGAFGAKSRFTEWNREFQAQVASNTVPAFLMVRFMNDHTVGLTPGKASPQAHVADNDYAVGQLVDAVSHSAIWNSTAIFVIEDDAQDGPDHVDAHRSTCYVLSPYIKRSSVDHTFYNTDSVLKTMEVLLNLPPMSQYDAVATPILDFDIVPNNSTPYTAVLPPQAILTDTNPKLSALKPGTMAYHLAKLSSKLDFKHPDSAPAALLTEMEWKSVKGMNAKAPAPRHSGLSLARPTSPKAAAHTAAKDSDGD